MFAAFCHIEILYQVTGRRKPSRSPSDSSSLAVAIIIITINMQDNLDQGRAVSWLAILVTSLRAGKINLITQFSLRKNII
jgi:hypothetical protein